MIFKVISLLLSAFFLYTYGYAEQYNESPMLKRLVKAGKIPAVDDRLPLEPYIVEGDKLVTNFTPKIGKYGGTFRLPMENPGGDPHIYIGMVEPLIWAPGAFRFDKGIHGNVVRDWKVNKDNSVFTFYLREGLKWSDGVPVTTEDVRFAWEDVLLNKEITPAFPTWLKTAGSPDGNPMKLEIIDDMTFKVIFDGPYGLFPVKICINSWRSYAWIIKPKHYMKKFHINYTSLDKLKPIMKEESIPEDQWYTLFNQKSVGNNVWKHTNASGIGHPSLLAWVMKRGQGGVFTYERNPYYWKVDAEGNQLPYMDKVHMEVIEDRETQFARTIMGDFDYLGERSSLKNLPMLAAAQKKGLLKVIIPYFHRSALDFKLNYNFPDPAFQEVVSNVQFRKALNFAINRPEILKTFYLNKFAKIEGKAFDGEYNQSKANEILDKIGMNKRDSNGFRMTPSGKEFSILFEQPAFSQDHIPMAELIAEHWKSVGINTSVKAGDSNIINTRLNNNEVQAMGLWAHTEIWNGGWDDFLPKNQWGVQWHNWMNTGGKTGIEPPPDVKEIYALEKEFNSQLVGTPESQKALDSIFELHKKSSYVFQPTSKARYPTMVTSRINNVPLGMVDEMGIVIMYSMEQWYIDE